MEVLSPPFWDSTSYSAWVWNSVVYSFEPMFRDSVATIPCLSGSLGRNQALKKEKRSRECRSKIRFSLPPVASNASGFMLMHQSQQSPCCWGIDGKEYSQWKDCNSRWRGACLQELPSCSAPPTQLNQHWGAKVRIPSWSLTHPP